MAQLHETLMGRKFYEFHVPEIAINLERIADALEQQVAILNPEDKIKIEICYYEDESGKKVYDIEHMQNEFDQKLKELQS
jgi:hypothetical protein